MNNRYISLLISLAVTIVLTMLIIFTYNHAASNPDENSSLLRFMTLLGGNMPLGIIQCFTFFLFFYAVSEIIHLNKIYRNEEVAFQSHLLPEKENWILSPGEVAQLKLDVMAKTKYQKTTLSKLILMVCTKFRANKSTSESLEVLSAQVKINKENDESGQSLIRYVAWAVPSVGFIGTVIGIATSLGAVKQNMGGEDLVAVTSALNVAFDTTLLSLFLSIILMFMYHRIQERMEKFHARCEQYVMDNLINRIYHS
jgi:biopolymer transport protein ExbB/TolQ